MDPDILNELMAKVAYIEGAVRCLCIMVGATMSLVFVLLILRIEKR